MSVETIEAQCCRISAGLYRYLREGNVLIPICARANSRHAWIRLNDPLIANLWRELRWMRECSTDPREVRMATQAISGMRRQGIRVDDAVFPQPERIDHEEING